MTRVLRFGAYTFADAGIRYEDNFAHTIIRQTRLLNAAVLDEDGIGAAGSAAGRVRYDAWLKASTAAGMVALRDGVKALARMSAQELVIQPETGGERFTRARLIRADLPEMYGQLTSLNQRVSLTWAAVGARWYSVTAPTNSGLTVICTGAATDFTRINNGNADAVPTITVTAGTAVVSVTVQRRVSGTAVESVTYSGGLAAGAVLVVDVRRQRVTVNGIEAYSSGFSALTPTWMLMPPGTSAFRVIAASGESAAVAVAWSDTWV